MDSVEELADTENESSRLYNTGDGSVDKNGNPVLKQNTGNWKACLLILGTECCERLAYCGISANLVSYLTKKLPEGNVSAARNVTTWQGTCCLAPLFGATLADSYWGRYWTITAFSTAYFIGMCTLIFSATFPDSKPHEDVDCACPSNNPAQYALFFLGLYLTAVGAGGTKLPRVSAFGVKKGPFFNWYYLSINIVALISSSFLVWIQGNAERAIGFGVPSLFMGIAIACFCLGTPLSISVGSPVKRICQVLVASLRKWNLEVPTDGSLLYETQTPAIDGSRKIEHSDGLKFFDKAAVPSDIEIITGDVSDRWKLCTVTQVEELKILIRMLPIWVTGIFFAAVYAQTFTTFVKQGSMMGKSFGSFDIPPAALACFDLISVIIWVSVYDGLIVPIARRFTGNERGFSELQRMGIGLLFSILSMSAAAVLETNRLDAPILLSIFWQTPQYFIMGAAEVFGFIGQLEFFYDESPEAMRSLYNALTLLTISLGDYLNRFILKMVAYFTSRGGKEGWIPDNLNEGHLDYFFWLLAGLSFFNILYIFCAGSYKPKQSAS